jgi:hypothetical protein
MEIGQVEAARRLGISLNRLNEMVLGKRGITADAALRLSRLWQRSPMKRNRRPAGGAKRHTTARSARPSCLPRSTAT